MKTIENKSDYETLLKLDRPILLDFYADWCGPCQTLLPTVEKLSKEYEGTIEIQKVNVDQNGPLAAQFGVRSIPTLVYLDNGKEISRQNGLISEGQLRDQLNELKNA